MTRIEAELKLKEATELLKSLDAEYKDCRSSEDFEEVGRKQEKALRAYAQAQREINQ